MTRIFVVYGHHNTKKSFNASIRDTFIDKSIIDKHINLGLQAISKHKQRETTLWDAYIERLLALQNK